MSSYRRQVWATLADLLQRIERHSNTADLQELKEEVRKLGKTQFKANTLAENQAAQWQSVLNALQSTQAQQGQPAELVTVEPGATNQQLLEALIPALDGVEEAIASGQRFLAQMGEASTEKRMLAGWLDGLRLVRGRLLAVLEEGGVTEIAAVGRPFDPYLHRVVGVTTELPESWANGRQGLIVSEERRGYQTPSGVLRYADVIVYRPGK